MSGIDGNWADEEGRSGWLDFMDDRPRLQRRMGLSDEQYDDAVDERNGAA